MHLMHEWQRDFLPTYTYVDAFIIGEYEKPSRLEKAWIIKLSFIWQFLAFVFNVYIICFKSIG